MGDSRSVITKKIWHRVAASFLQLAEKGLGMLRQAQHARIFSTISAFFPLVLSRLKDSE
jgi:hypothetical protein